MKKRIFILQIILILSFYSCSKKLVYYERNGLVEFISSEKNTITVKTKSFAESYNKAINFAEINVLENILYRGIPRSNQENPMVNENDVKNNKALNDLIYNDGYRKFLIDSRNVNYQENNGLFYITQEIKFDLNALRRYLEDNRIVRKFGL